MDEAKIVAAVEKAMITQFLRRGAVPPWKTLARIAVRVIAKADREAA